MTPRTPAQGPEQQDDPQDHPRGAESYPHDGQDHPRQGHSREGPLRQGFVRQGFARKEDFAAEDSSREGIVTVPDIIRSNVYVDGTACVGKSSALLQLMTHPRVADLIEFGDYREDVLRFPLYRQKYRMKYANKLYSTWLLIRLKSGRIYDRCFLADFVYEIIFDILTAQTNETGHYQFDADGRLEKPRGEVGPDGLDVSTYEDAHVRRCMEVALDHLEPAIQEILRTMCVVVCVDGDVETVMARMVARNNGIDVLDPRYVLYQNAAFRYVAERFGWITLEKTREESMTSYVQRVHEQAVASWEKVKCQGASQESSSAQRPSDVRQARFRTE
ncbi:hypothetical protein GNI_150160 [Gregarina niphandrodes]|uniref:Deoxynucleoside kinase n=1 Tax=Gregarina niphandrodes TaxID=110365 RepID=A0A023B0G6_GRENI|nr:hypothetical protein GNI_150160 [Gregarina niphandrodes]EZG44233.1 hypothetical protein GNI_150160 [Gregarina niphandrodes]|eukprot:XP_011132751.1 hypothetical protein GNI_150160 [Gregarina niphandrodes]